MAKTNQGDGSITYTIRNGKKYYTARLTLYKDVGGTPVRKSFSGYKKSEVQRKLKEAQKLRDELGYKGFTTTFGGMFYHWLFEVKKTVLTPRALEKYESLYRLKVKNFKLNNVILTDLTSALIQEHFNRIIETGVITIKGAKELLRLLKSYSNYLYTNDYIIKNYCTNIVLPREELEPVEIKFFTKEEQIKLQENLDLEKEVDLMILLMLSSGLRSGEARGLKWGSLKSNALTIDHQIQFVTRVEKDGTRSSKEEISELKTASSYRKIPLPESVSKVLKKAQNKTDRNETTTRKRVP